MMVKHLLFNHQKKCPGAVWDAGAKKYSKLSSTQGVKPKLGLSGKIHQNPYCDLVHREQSEKWK